MIETIICLLGGFIVSYALYLNSKSCDVRRKHRELIESMKESPQAGSNASEWEVCQARLQEVQNALNIVMDKLNEKHERVQFSAYTAHASAHYPNATYYRVDIWVNLFWIEMPPMIMDIDNVVVRASTLASMNNKKVIETLIYYEDYQKQIDKIEILLERYVAVKKDEPIPEDYHAVKNLLELSITKYEAE